MGDELLFKSKGPKSKFFWRPRNGRSVVLPNKPYAPFNRIVRTVHVDEALQMCQEQKMEPKPVSTNSCLSMYALKNTNHPCKRLKVLWFGTEPGGDGLEHDWYGNIQFSASANILLNKWKFCFLVELMTAMTHTTTRVLITNTDYSSVLPVYDPYQQGGPWYIDSQGQHYVLSDCCRYNSEGFNKNGHNLEFMIEVTPSGGKGILKECVISFREHLRALDTRLPLRCHRTQFRNEECPFPVSSITASKLYFYRHESMCSLYPTFTPALTEDAKHYLRCYYNVESNVPQSLIPSDQQQFVPNFPPRPIPRGPTPDPSNFLNLQYLGLLESIQSFSQSRVQQRGTSFSNITRKTITPWGVNNFQQISINQTYQTYPNNNHSLQGREERRQNRGENPECNQNAHNNTGLYNPQSQQMHVIHAWWLSLDSYCRDVLMWFWSQNQLQEEIYIPGWPTPKQHQRHPTRRQPQ
ncbi:uncharacterized protein [Palaemon carinicauda]|uniref:uncharacterized protein isoform X2 n=1 Tax=Palaemon carinicauda TaxID=392227 RepID=UPI0035B69D9F